MGEGFGSSWVRRCTPTLVTLGDLLRRLVIATGLCYQRRIRRTARRREHFNVSPPPHEDGLVLQPAPS